jgi:hypothetical protein
MPNRGMNRSALPLGTRRAARAGARLCPALGRMRQCCN